MTNDVILALACFILIFLILIYYIRQYFAKKNSDIYIKDIKLDTLYYRTDLPIDACIARLNKPSEEDFVFYEFSLFEGMTSGTLIFTGLTAYAKATRTEFSIKLTGEETGTLIEMHYLKDMFLTSTPVTFDNLVDPFLYQKISAKAI